MDFKKKNECNRLEPRKHILENADGAEVLLLHFPLLESAGGTKHCFTTRMGGVSEGIYASMNFRMEQGERQEAVRENFRRVAAAMGSSEEWIVAAAQTHTTNIRKVCREDAGKGVIRPRDYDDVDGLITNEPGLILATFYADCVPLYFVDPVHKAIGLSHSGWRGTVGRMGEKTLRAMAEEYHTNPADVYAAVGPSICRDCYEISADVAECFYKEFPKQGNEILLDKKNGKYQLDLWKANECVLLDAGILPHHLAVTNICTCCNEKLLFSHRATMGKRGNLGAFLMLKDTASDWE